MTDHQSQRAHKAPRRRDADTLSAQLGAHDSLQAASSLASRVLDKLRGLDFHGYEGMPAEEGVPRLMQGPVCDAVRLLSETLRLVRSLPRLVGAQEPVVWDADEVLVDSEPVAASSISEGAPAPYQPGLSQAVDQDLDAALIDIQSTHWRHQGADSKAQLESYAALCGRTVLSLKEALEALREARRERAKWGLIAAGEEARRSARKALQVTCYVAMRLMAADGAADFLAKEPTELQTALGARGVLMRYVAAAQSLHTGDVAPDASQLIAQLRYLRLFLQALFLDPNYDALRAPDRYGLQQWYGASGIWLDTTPSDLAQGRRLIEQALQLASVMGRINGRRVLTLYDCAVSRKARGELGLLVSGQSGHADPLALRQHFIGILTHLGEMRWRCSVFDALVRNHLMTLHAAPPVADCACGSAPWAGRARQVLEALEAVRFL